jgi:hypothetical protein
MNVLAGQFRRRKKRSGDLATAERKISTYIASTVKHVAAIFIPQLQSVNRSLV